MPHVLRRNIPRHLYDHLLDRIHQRQFTSTELVSLIRWLDTQPEVPKGKWFKRFLVITVCGEGELIKPFLTPGQAPFGDEFL